MSKQCVLYDRPCTGCGECDYCDLNPIKLCDNCGKCLEADKDYREIKIDGLIMPKDEHNHNHNCCCGHEHNSHEH